MRLVSRACREARKRTASSTTPRAKPPELLAIALLLASVRARVSVDRSQGVAFPWPYVLGLLHDLPSRSVVNKMEDMRETYDRRVRPSWITP